MRIVQLSLICLIAFAFMVGCGMMGQQAEMSTPATATDSAAMKSDAKSASDVAEAVEETAIEEITLNVTGMT